MAKFKVFLTGKDNINWALDEDVRLTKQAIGSIVEFTNLKASDVVHAIWWGGLIDIPWQQLVGKRIICHLENPPFHWLKQTNFRFAFDMVDTWVVRGTEAQRQLASLGIDSQLIPYNVDTNIFYPVSSTDSDLSDLRKRWDIPDNRYIIGNFHRDTEGYDLSKLKLQKGPDIFVEIVKALVAKGYPIHVLLAGPRRFWIRHRLEELELPYTFIGEWVQGSDDIAVNILPRSTLNLLYNLLDIYLITSRWEGGPHSIMEAAASKCKVVSTQVGFTEDILDPKSIYSSVVEAVTVIERDIVGRDLDQTVEPQYHRIVTNHQTDRVAPHYKELYTHVKNVSPFAGFPAKRISAETPKHNPSSPLRRVLRRVGISLLSKKNSRFSVSLWHEFHKPPYGGGNQFMMALRDILEKRGVAVRNNRLSPDVDAHICNSAWFNVKKFLKYSQRNQLRMIHRIDGPISLYRGSDRTLDDQIFELNAQFASITVIQSAWTYQRLVAMGYRPVNPVIMHNAVDPAVFHQDGRVDFDPDRKIRLISTSWSDNPRKGGPIYKWIEEHLDWSRFEYTFVGRASERFDRIHHLPPVPSEKLAGILRQHDIYITASQNDPCSNALIEALTCGLPALYLNSGGHPELVGYGGLPFVDVEEILPQLDILVENYQMFQNVISVPSLEDVADKYLRLLRNEV